MKSFILVIIVSLLIFNGCSSSNVQNGAPSPVLKPAAPKEGIVYKAIKFERISLGEAPQKILQLYEKNREQYKVIVSNDSQYTYIIAMMGQKPTGGYSIKVSSIEDIEEGKLKITLKTETPEPGSMVTQALTFPVDIARIPVTNLPMYAVDSQGNSIEVQSLR